MRKIDIALLFSALVMSLAPAYGMVWVFYNLGIKGTHIVPDNRNIIELYMSVFVLILLVVACIRFIRYMIKGGGAKQ